MFEYYKSFFLILFGMAMAASEARKEYFRCADLEKEIIPLVTKWTAEFFYSSETDSDAYFQKRFDRWWKDVQAKPED